MAENPRFNNSGMFKDASDDYSEIKPDNTSEVLATQGNVINSIKVFWNKLRAKLAYAVTRPDYGKAVGGNYQPIYVNNSGDVAPCSPSVFQAVVNNSTINLPDAFPIYAGQVICFNVTNGSGDNSGDLKIGDISVYYPTGATVKGSDVIGGSYLFTYISGNGDKWILNNKINVVSGDNDGLMTVAEHNKLAGIAEHANAYELPTANANDIGGVKSVVTGTTANRDYNVQVNSDGTMKVNVPWTDTHEANWEANLRVGTANSIDNDTTSDTQETYIKTVENGEVHGRVKVVGSKGVTISSTSNGELEINGPTIPSYTILYNNGDTVKNYSSSKGYLVYGPGSSKANTSNYLRGDGSWGAPAASMGSMSVEYTGNAIQTRTGYASASIKVTYNGSGVNYMLLGPNGNYISNNGSGISALGDAQGFKYESITTINSCGIIIPIGNSSLKPQLIHFDSMSRVEII